ncbi:MAG: ParB/RepB/Spo0J family partition protein [Thermoproteota archaeon]|nr:ParB/RepB/Spo0J family partition protein [Thermoproteota archaeon]
MITAGIFFQIPIQDIRISHRLLRNPSTSIEDLLISIKQKGLINPLTVRLKDNYYEIIAGHRRLEACKGLGWKKVICHIVDVDDKTAYEMSVIENVQQKTMSPIEEARAFKDYVETFGWGSESDLASRIGKSQEYISKRRRLLSLPPSLQQDMLEGRMKISTAEELLPLNDSEIVRELGNYIKKNALNKQETRRVVKVLRNDTNVQDMLLKEAIASTTSFKDFEQSNTEDDSLPKVYDTLNAMFERSMLGIRISLKNIDDLVEDMSDEQYGHLRFGWLIREIIMQHRFTLHQQLDLLLRQRSKLERLHKRHKK